MKQKVHSFQGKAPHKKQWDVLPNATARRVLTAHLILTSNFTGKERSPEKLSD